MINEITILIPTYNRAELLNKNLESIQNQDFKGRIKCVISDNNSSDDTYDVYEKWKNRNKNIYLTFLKNEKNIPPIENFINTTKHIDTDYSKFLQDDDWLEPDAISKISKGIEEYSADSLIFNCNIFSYREKNSKKNYYKLRNEQVSVDNIINSFLRLKSPIPTSPSISVQKSNLIHDALLFGKMNVECSNLLLGNDLIFTYLNVFENKNVFFINESIVNFWGGEDSITMYANKNMFSSCYFKSLMLLIEKFNIAISKQQKEIIEHRIFVHNFKKLYSKELKNIQYNFQYKSKPSISQLKKYILSKLD